MCVTRIHIIRILLRGHLNCKLIVFTRQIMTGIQACHHYIVKIKSYMQWQSQICAAPIGDVFYIHTCFMTYLRPLKVRYSN